MSQIFNGNRGISIIEILVVVFIISVTLTSLLGLIGFSLGAASLMKQTTQANFLGQETMEAIRNFRDNTSWNTNGLGTLTLNSLYHPEKTAETPPKWNLVSGGEVLGIFTRKVVFEKVYRDGNDNIAESGTEDPNTKKATVTVSWQERRRSHQVKIVTYLTNWK